MRLRSRHLDENDAAIARALIKLGWLQSDVASLLGCNSGRISEIDSGKRFAGIAPADLTADAVRGLLAERLSAWNVRVGRLVTHELNPRGLL